MSGAEGFTIDLGGGMSVYLQPGGCAEIRLITDDEEDDDLMHPCRWREQIPAIVGAIRELEYRRRAENGVGEVARDHVAGQ